MFDGCSRIAEIPNADLKEQYLDGSKIRVADNEVIWLNDANVRRETEA